MSVCMPVITSFLALALLSQSLLQISLVIIYNGQGKIRLSLIGDAVSIDHYVRHIRIKDVSKNLTHILFCTMHYGCVRSTTDVQTGIVFYRNRAALFKNRFIIIS